MLRHGAVIVHYMLKLPLKSNRMIHGKRNLNVVKRENTCLSSVELKGMTIPFPSYLAWSVCTTAAR